MNAQTWPSPDGYFGCYGGRFVPETLMQPLYDLESCYSQAARDPAFWSELYGCMRHYAGRPTPITPCERLSRELGGARILLKREDLNHTGSHKLNSCLGQGLLALRMAKTRLIAETGAGQHGVATATVAARMGLSCTVYMGAEDMQRQVFNVVRMQQLGAEVRPVHSGSQTLKDATNQALRDWAETLADTYYCIGSVVGPHPYPRLVRDFQAVIGTEARRQMQDEHGALPQVVVACVGGGSNAAGMFSAFVNDPEVRLVGVEAGGRNDSLGNHAATLSYGTAGVLHGAYTKLLQDQDGQIATTHSVSAGLDYPGVGPEHAWLQASGRAEYTCSSDVEALAACRRLTACEGIVPALESAHAVAWALEQAAQMPPEHTVLICLSGRGDKDLEQMRSVERPS
jgi:tryptophan synthase beta chain